MDESIKQLFGEMKYNKQRLEKISYLSMLNIFIIIAVQLKFAPSRIEVLSIGFKVPIVIVPLVLAIAHIVTFRHYMTQINQLLLSGQIMLYRLTRQTSDDDVKKDNEVKLNQLYDGFNMFHAYNVIVSVGLFCGFCSFVTINLELMMIFAPDIMGYLLDLPSILVYLIALIESTVLFYVVYFVGTRPERPFPF